MMYNFIIGFITYTLYSKVLLHPRIHSVYFETSITQNKPEYRVSIFIHIVLTNAHNYMLLAGRYQLPPPK